MTEKREPSDEEVVDKTIDLAKFLLAFGRIDRVVKHEDGVTWESDSDHTVMLGVMACAFAKEYAPHLDTGKIAEFALVHDLVEVYAGDTMSFRIATTDQTNEKAAREHAALERIKEEFGSVFPWLPEKIEEYETLSSPEACYVKFFDKILPKITHILNNGVVVKELGHTKETTHAFHIHQITSITESYGKEHPQVAELYNAIAERLVARLY